MNVIKSASFIKSSVALSECPKSKLPEYAFIGRSNVGKSSLINCLTNRKKLAKVSVKPGKTQLINHFLIDKSWYLVDLPGYGWAKVSKTEKAKWKLMINEYLQKRENLYCVFLLIDCRHEPQGIDREFMRWLGENEIPFVIVFTKTDKLGQVNLQKRLDQYREVLSEEWDELPIQFETSSISGEGKDQIIDYVMQINRK
ncbi:MAG: YihA family ribosome biogenesis GTP-binding protein [Flammeovirgaceae bacterium]|nr:YihA family ribosome biogenesis GTP-binding protein [Flammeovirgaceae bacterium]